MAKSRAKTRRKDTTVGFGDWYVTGRAPKKGGAKYAYATIGHNKARRRWSMDILFDSPPHVLRAKLVAFVQERQMKEVRGDLTIGRIYELWCQHKEDEGQVSAETVRYHWVALSPTFSELHPTDISTKLCKDYSVQRALAGKASATVWSELRSLQTALNFAVSERWLTQEIKIWSPSVGKSRKRVATPDEIGRVLRAIDPDTAGHLRTVVLLAILTGARRAAILDLTWDKMVELDTGEHRPQVDFERQAIHYRGEDVQVWNPLTKGYSKGRASVPMGPVLSSYLYELREKNPSSRHVVEYEGQRISRCDTALNKVMKRAGVEGVTLHTLRHTMASWAKELGADPRDIAQQLGHARGSKITEKVYIHDSVDAIRHLTASIEEKITT